MRKATVRRQFSGVSYCLCTLRRWLHTLLPQQLLPLVEQLSLFLPLDWIQISLHLRWHVGCQLSLSHSLWTLSIENAVQSYVAKHRQTLMQQLHCIISDEYGTSCTAHGGICTLRCYTLDIDAQTTFMNSGDHGGAVAPMLSKLFICRQNM